MISRSSPPLPHSPPACIDEVTHTHTHLITVLFHCESAINEGLEEVRIELQVARGKNPEITHHIIGCRGVAKTLETRAIKSEKKWKYLREELTVSSC